MTERRVLFIGAGEASGAVIARAMFNDEPPDGWSGAVAAIEPNGVPEWRTVRLLHEVGLDVADDAPARLTRLLTEQADLRVTVGARDHPRCPSYLRSFPLIDWRLPEPSRLDEVEFRLVREQIRTRVLELKVSLLPILA